MRLPSLLARTLAPTCALALTCVLALAAHAQDALPPPPTERYGVAWGDSQDAVVVALGGAPDSDVPTGTLTYLGRDGAQAAFVFDPGLGGPALVAVVEASGQTSDVVAVVGAHDGYLGGLTARYGPPTGGPVETDGPLGDRLRQTAWDLDPGLGGVRFVELGFATTPEGLSYLYVRFVGPAAGG